MKIRWMPVNPCGLDVYKGWPCCPSASVEAASSGAVPMWFCFQLQQSCFLFHHPSHS